jgi:hypothetical protein
MPLVPHIPFPKFNDLKISGWWWRRVDEGFSRGQRSDEEADGE